MKEKIAVIVGSKSDLPVIKPGLDLCQELGIGYTLEVISAHRHPDKLRNFCKKQEKNGVEVIIACAGMAAALPGFVASYVDIPVIGVALSGGLLDGLDALLSIVSTPAGMGLVCSGLGKSAFINAIIFSMEIVAVKDHKAKPLLLELKKKFR